MPKFKEIKEEIKEKAKRKPPNPKGNQRPRVAKPHRSIKDSAKEEERKNEVAVINNQVKKVKKLAQDVIEKFNENPKPFFKKKLKEVENLIEQVALKRQDDMESGMVMSKKDYITELAYYITQPVIPFSGMPQKYNPTTMKFISDIYWQKIIIPANRIMVYPPSIHEMLKMANISFGTFNDYYNNGTAEMRNTCEIINDQFVTYFQRAGMTDLIKENTAMFIQKTTYKQKENDTTPIIINNSQLSLNDKMTELFKSFGKDVEILVNQEDEE